MRLIIETGIFDKVIKMKYDVPNANIGLLDDYNEMIDKALATID
jgi:V/A-type H+-transporting ATPase subunit A